MRDDRRTCGRGELVRLLYRLGQRAAGGMLTLSAPAARPEVFVLRRGAVVCAAGEPARRAVSARLARAAGEPAIAASVDGITAYPPGAPHQVALAGWVRAHLEAQLDRSLADVLEHELASVQLTLRAELAPEPLDDTDRRMLAALAQPRRLDQLGLACAPRLRLLAFLHFLRGVGALAVDGASGARGAAVLAGARRAAALRVLGVDAGADRDAVKRAYRRLARALHPDLQPHVDDRRRRQLEQRFAELTDAYQALM